MGCVKIDFRVRLAHQTPLDVLYQSPLPNWMMVPSDITVVLPMVDLAVYGSNGPATSRAQGPSEPSTGPQTEKNT